MSTFDGDCGHVNLIWWIHNCVKKKELYCTKKYVFKIIALYKKKYDDI